MKIRTLFSIVRTRYYSFFHNIKVGKHTYFWGKTELLCEGSTEIGEHCSIGPWVAFREYGGYITIGNNCTINSFCHISGNGGVEIGDNVRIATQCVLVSANHNFSKLDTPIYLQGEQKGKIIIEEDCWLGAGVKVLAGVTIGKGSVIGAGAVVNKTIPPYSIAVGVPAKVIKSREQLSEVNDI